MLMQRLLAALVLIPIVLIALFFLPITFFVGLVIIICGLGVWEWTQFLSVNSPIIRRYCVIISTMLLMVIYYLLPNHLVYLLFDYALILGFCWWLSALVLVTTYPKSAKFWENSCFLKGLFGFCTLFPFFGGMIILRSISYENNPYFGAFVLLYVLILIWATDTGAYFVGRMCGKHKLASKVSPGKTVEGLIGGVITAMLIAAVTIHFFYNDISFGKLMIISLITILASALGDLTESMFKRTAGIKDSGTLIPGHGGILDRIDSLTSAVPLFTALLLIIQ
ncbi:MAG: phosphatidate cytidylyltransferase [Candidatus Schmidhempelia sp.]|nr:phosphatidate cytidylyltransferase [Candidatus Schmidhempelia sp.]